MRKGVPSVETPGTAASSIATLPTNRTGDPPRVPQRCASAVHVGQGTGSECGPGRLSGPGPRC